MLESLERAFRRLLPPVDYCALRFVEQRHELVSVRQDVPQPFEAYTDRGASWAVCHEGGIGHAATCDTTQSGLRAALSEAMAWSRAIAGRTIFDFSLVKPEASVGEFVAPAEIPWDSRSLGEKYDLLRQAARRLKTDDRIVDWEASFWHMRQKMLLLTSGGGRIWQDFQWILPLLRARAHRNSDIQQRTYGGHGYGRQGGLEILDHIGFHDAPPRVADEALQLLAAPQCPSDRRDLLLAADQMFLQIHESIGHPLELDRILGDERNYAGSSFVTPDMFGRYRYGSELLNVAHDPTLPGAMGSFGYDDLGTPAQRVRLIEGGLLLRPLGGLISATRSGLPGVACSRACGWNRPPIDRMANVNIEPGASTWDDLLAGVSRGILMKTNCSWSIDDTRNKFQFGCEWGQLIEDGRLTTVVKNPNYRGRSATFWRSLAAVGNEATVELLGTPWCGKGEPNQSIWVGHASPACLFRDVEVFGGAS